MTDDEPQPSDLSDFQRARAEAAGLLGLDLGRLSPSDSLKLDLCVVLRRAIDVQTEGAFDGEPIDIQRLMIAIEKLSALLPQLTSPTRADPRAALLAMLLEMRERKGLSPDEGSCEQHTAEISALRAENSQLRRLAKSAGLAIAGPASGEVDIVPPSEQADRSFYRGMPKPAPDDPKEPVTIEGTATRVSPSLDDVVATYAAPEEPWRRFTRIDWQG
jgi:hypothetical protein